MLNHYLILETIGEGSYAKVKLASRRLIGIEQKYALKIFSKGVLKKKIDFIHDKNGSIRLKNAFEDVKTEIAIMKKVNHPNLIRLNEVIDDQHSEQLIMG